MKLSRSLDALLNLAISTTDAVDVYIQESEQYLAQIKDNLTPAQKAKMLLHITDSDILQAKESRDQREAMEARLDTLSTTLCIFILYRTLIENFSR